MAHWYLANVPFWLVMYLWPAVFMAHWCTWYMAHRIVDQWTTDSVHLISKMISVIIFKLIAKRDTVSIFWDIYLMWEDLADD